MRARETSEPTPRSVVFVSVLLGIGVGMLLSDAWHFAIRLALVAGTTGLFAMAAGALLRARGTRQEPGTPQG